MEQSSEPWYIHVALYIVIAILTIILIKVAIIDPKKYVEKEKYYKTESRLRMDNIKEGEILWQKEKGVFTDNLDDLINFIKTDPKIDSIRKAKDTVWVTSDSIKLKSLDPFEKLTQGGFVPESLKWAPKSHVPYILQIDTSVSVDTFITRRGKISHIDTTIVLGNRYFLKDPDGYGSIGSLDNDALKNTASWE